MSSPTVLQPYMEDHEPVSEPYLGFEEEPRRPSAFTILSLGLLVFSFIFEDASFGGIEPWMLSGVIFISASLIQPRLFFRKPTSPIIVFGLFVVVCILVSLLQPISHVGESTKRCFQFSYLLVLAWMMSNLMRLPKLMTVALVSLAAATVMLASLQITGIAASSWGRGIGERITVFGFHPNQLAFNFSLGIVTILGLSGYREIRRRPPMWMLFLIMGIVAAALVDTGSRGGLIAVAVGTICYCLQPGNARQRMNAIVMTVVGMAMMVLMVTQSESTMTRIDEAVGEGNIARRDLIYPIALDMFQERPIFGWGVMENTFELGSRFQEPGRPDKDTHNAILFVLTATGLVGTVPFLFGLFLAFRSAWQARKSTIGIMPFALAFCVLAAAMGVTLIQAKIFWLIMAISIASSHMEHSSSLSSRRYLAP